MNNYLINNEKYCYFLKCGEDRIKFMFTVGRFIKEFLIEKKL